MPGTFMRAIAIIPPGMFLSQPPTTSTPSMAWPLTLVSMASAITSRDSGDRVADQRLYTRVARIHRRVAVGDADDRLFEIAVAEANGAQHGAVGRAGDAVRDGPA